MPVDRIAIDNAPARDGSMAHRVAPHSGVMGGSPEDLNLPLRVKELRRESSDCLSVLFEKPPGFSYSAGDWMDLRFLSADLAVGRTYSFASSPTEPELRTTFKRGKSPFKRALEVVSPGDILLITQHGSNGFLLDRRFPSLFVAGGIGITPFRSMIKDAIDTGVGEEMTLIYQNHTDDFPFQHELDAWAAIVPSLTVRYVPTGIHGRLTLHMLRTLLPDGLHASARSYIAGPPGMVEQTEKMLVAMGGEKAGIKTDSFRGYA